MMISLLPHYINFLRRIIWHKKFQGYPLLYVDFEEFNFLFFFLMTKFEKNFHILSEQAAWYIDDSSAILCVEYDYTGYQKNKKTQAICFAKTNKNLFIFFVKNKNCILKFF